MPANASISFTLSNCYTQTSLEIQEGEGVEVFLDGQRETGFEPKISQFRERISEQFDFITQGKWIVQTTNSFPHSSGIASSASGLSALSLCLCDLAVAKGLLTEEKREQKASELARLGSGSASRSVYGPLAVWGEHPDFPKSSDQYAIAYQQIHENFKDYRDVILLVHRGQKAVSSTLGHGLIEGHPFAQARFEMAQQNMAKMKDILKSGNLPAFVDIVEQEALTLHALMLSSNPSFVLMKAGTLDIIEAIRTKREEGFNWCFTLDAGANVHFLFPASDEPLALDFVEKVLKQHCQDGAYICDQLGAGPVRQ